MIGKILVVGTSDEWTNSIKRKAIGYELAEDWMLFWALLIPCTIIVELFTRIGHSVIKEFLYVPLIFAITAARRFIVGSFKYLVLNCTILLVAFVLPFTFIEKVIYTVYICLRIFVSFKKRRTEVIKFYNLWSIFCIDIVMILCYFAAVNFNLVFEIKLINFASVNIAVTFILYLFFSRTLRLHIWEGQLIAEYPNRIRNIKTASSVLITLTIGVFLLAAWKIGLYKLLDLLTIRLLAFFNAERNYETKPQVMKPIVNNTNQALNKAFEKIIPRGKSSYIAAVIEKIFYYAMLALLLIVLLYFTYHLLIAIRDFYRGLLFKKAIAFEKREFEFSLEIKKQLKERTKRYISLLNMSFGTTNQQKIRKMYYKAIKAYRARGVPIFYYDTPIEIEQKVRTALNYDISKATCIYEKARYNKMECTNEDVEKIKAYLIE